MDRFSSFWNPFIYVFICTKIKKITIDNFFSLDACSDPKCAPCCIRGHHRRLDDSLVVQLTTHLQVSGDLESQPAVEEVETSSSGALTMVDKALLGGVGI